MRTLKLGFVAVISLSMICCAGKKSVCMSITYEQWDRNYNIWLTSKAKEVADSNRDWNNWNSKSISVSSQTINELMVYAEKQCDSTQINTMTSPKNIYIITIYSEGDTRKCYILDDSSTKKYFDRMLNCLEGPSSKADRSNISDGLERFLIYKK